MPSWQSDWYFLFCLMWSFEVLSPLCGMVTNVVNEDEFIGHPFWAHCVGWWLCPLYSFPAFSTWFWAHRVGWRLSSSACRQRISSIVLSPLCGMETKQSTSISLSHDRVLSPPCGMATLCLFLSRLFVLTSKKGSNSSCSKPTVWDSNWHSYFPNAPRGIEKALSETT